MSKKRVEFKFYLDIEGTDKHIMKVIMDTVSNISWAYDKYEPLIEPYQWRELSDDSDYSHIECTYS